MSKRSTIATVAGLVVAAAAIAQDFKCPIDNTGMMWTGKTRVEMGKMLYEYRCLHGHTTWVVK